MKNIISCIGLKSIILGTLYMHKKWYISCMSVLSDRVWNSRPPLYHFIEEKQFFKHNLGKLLNINKDQLKKVIWFKNLLKLYFKKPTRVKWVFFPCRTWFFFLLRSQKMDLFALQGETKCTLWHASRNFFFNWSEYNSRWFNQTVFKCMLQNSKKNLSKRISLVNYLVICKIL